MIIKINDINSKGMNLIYYVVQFKPLWSAELR